MFGTDEKRRSQEWRNESKARYLFQQHGERAIELVRDQVRSAGFNLKLRSHWKRVERHITAIIDGERISQS